MSSGMTGHQSHKMGKDAWLTPPHVISALGVFDLDPCASQSRPWDTAVRHLTIDDDGLSRDWAGRVWLNPPYGAMAAAWLQKMANHGCGTALVFARTETAMFHQWVWPFATAVLLLRGRLTFHHPNGDRAKHNGGAPSILIAYGRDDAATLEACELPGFYMRLRGVSDA